MGLSEASFGGTARGLLPGLTCLSMPGLPPAPITSRKDLDAWSMQATWEPGREFPSGLTSWEGAPHSHPSPFEPTSGQPVVLAEGGFWKKQDRVALGPTSLWVSAPEFILVLGWQKV